MKIVRKKVIMITMITMLIISMVSVLLFSLKVTSINPSVDLYKGEIVKINVPISSYLSNFRPIWAKLLKITQIWEVHPALREPLFPPKGINRGSLNINNKNAVVEFLDSLESEQLKKVSFSFDDVSRYSWHYFPDNWWQRQGIQIKELDRKQKNLLFQMLKGFLSEEGYAKTQKIIDLENVLAEIEKKPKIRNPENYFIAIYGNPRKDRLWAWSFEGHHISLNYTILNNKIHVSPRFFGADPAIILQGKRKGERTLEREEDIAYELMNELTEQQKQKAIFRRISFRNIVTSNKQKVKPLKPVGIKMSALNAMQKSKLKQLIAVYINALPKDIALLREHQIFQEEFDAIRFAWAGKTIRGVPHYYRIQGKSFLIEFANTQNNANHIHSVWRDFNGDFGRDLMKEHYQKYHKND